MQMHAHACWYGPAGVEDFVNIPIRVLDGLWITPPHTPQEAAVGYPWDMTFLLSGAAAKVVVDFGDNGALTTYADQTSSRISVQRVYSYRHAEGYFYVTISAWLPGADLSGPASAQVVVPVRTGVRFGTAFACPGTHLSPRIQCCR